jgi:hypothetical protein
MENHWNEDDISTNFESAASQSDESEYSEGEEQVPDPDEYDSLSEDWREDDSTVGQAGWQKQILWTMSGIKMKSEFSSFHLLCLKFIFMRSAQKLGQTAARNILVDRFLRGGRYFIWREFWFLVAKCEKFKASGTSRFYERYIEFFRDESNPCRRAPGKSDRFFYRKCLKITRVFLSKMQQRDRSVPRVEHTTQSK